MGKQKRRRTPGHPSKVFHHEASPNSTIPVLVEELKKVSAILEQLKMTETKTALQTVAANDICFFAWYFIKANDLDEELLRA